MADTATTAGRGVIYIALAKFYFMMAGYVVYFILSRLLTPLQWGNYQLVVRLVSVINNVLIVATIQAVSKFTAEDTSRAQGVKRAALKIQLLLGGGLALLYMAAAPFIARWERDETLTSLYQLSTGVMFCYALYAVFVGTLNGFKQFGRQATLDISFSTMRGILILGFSALGWGVTGAIGGFALAALVILIIATCWVGLPQSSSQRFSVSTIWRFMLQLFLYTLTLNLIMGADLFLLKRFGAALSGEPDLMSQANTASIYAGFYAAAQTLAFIPYQAILAVAFVIFPLISRSTFENDLTTTQRYIRQTLRLSLIFVVGVAVVFMANSNSVMRMVYPAQYQIGGTPLRILALGMIFFSMFAILNTILNGAGLTRHAIVSGIVTLAITIISNSLLVPHSGDLPTALKTAGWATAGAMAAGMIISTIMLYYKFKSSFPLLSVLRIVGAMVVALVVGHLIPEKSKIFTMFECLLVFGCYFVTLAMLREFDAEDWARFQKILPHKQKILL